MYFFYWIAHTAKNKMLKSQKSRFILDQITADIGSNLWIRKILILIEQDFF